MLNVRNNIFLLASKIYFEPTSLKCFLNNCEEQYGLKNKLLLLTLKVIMV